MRHARQVIAVALVATALCADRAAEAAPALRAQTLERSAGGIVQRITARISRVVQRVAIVETRREGTLIALAAQTFGNHQAADPRPSLRLTLPQLPLPPPVL